MELRAPSCVYEYIQWQPEKVVADIPLTPNYTVIRPLLLITNPEKLVNAKRSDEAEDGGLVLYDTYQHLEPRVSGWYRRIQLRWSRTGVPRSVEPSFTSTLHHCLPVPLLKAWQVNETARELLCKACQPDMSQDMMSNVDGHETMAYACLHQTPPQVR